MDGTFSSRSGVAGQQADARMGHLGKDDTNRIRRPVIRHGQPVGLRTEPSLEMPRPRLLSTVLEVEPVHPPHDRAAHNAHVAPSPDTVVASSLRHTVAMEEAAKLREAVLGAQHATEMARLISTIEDQRKAHATEIARLGAEHADALHRAINANWRTRDTARAALERPIAVDDKTALGRQARSPVRLLPRREWLASIIGASVPTEKFLAKLRCL